MSDYPDLYLLRHGQTEWNAADRMQGALDSPLTAKGREQAAAQGVLLDAFDLSEFGVWVSPQGRAMQTAEIALRGRLQAQPDPRVREISVGQWDGKSRADIRAAHPDKFREDDLFYWYDHAPGGERYAGLETRCRSFLDDLTGPAIIFTHGVTSRMLRCVALGWGSDRIGDLPGGQGIIHCIRNRQQSVLG